MRIYVGHLNYRTTEDMLREAFEQFGEVEEVFIATDRQTGRPRGFAFVTMADDGKGAEAVEGLNGQELDGFTLTVNEARPRPAGGGGGGGGGGRGGYGGGGGGGRGRDRGERRGGDRW